MRHARVVFCALVLALGGILGGCGADEPPAEPVRTLEPQVTASSPSPNVTDPDSAVCSLLTSKERASIAGAKLDFVVPVVQKAKQCRWVQTASSPLPAIELTASPAREWASQLPSLIENMVKAGRVDPKFSKRLQAAKRKVLRGADKMGKREVCDLFSLIVEANGGKKDSETLVYFLPSVTGDITASVQTCSRGVNTIVTYSETGLRPSEPLGQAMLRLADLAHQRAIKTF
jgi:hypothetical protein